MAGHERTRELGDSHRLIALGTAAAKIIHDLANPLNAISTLPSVLARSRRVEITFYIHAIVRLCWCKSNAGSCRLDPDRP